jgi:hypothetical protein
MPSTQLFDTNLLLPRQYVGVGEEVVAGYRQLIQDPTCDPFHNGKRLEPIPLVPLNDNDPSQGLIVADGHHRAVAHHQKRVPIPGILYATDADIAACTDEPTLKYYESLAEFREDYLTIILPKVKEYGRATMQAYVQAHEAELRSFYN